MLSRATKGLYCLVKTISKDPIAKLSDLSNNAVETSLNKLVIYHVHSVNVMSSMNKDVAKMWHLRFGHLPFKKSYLLFPEVI